MMPIIEIRMAEVLREIQDLVWAYSFLVAGRFSVERELFEKEAGNLGEAELGGIYLETICREAVNEVVMIDEIATLEQSQKRMEDLHTKNSFTEQ